MEKFCKLFETEKYGQILVKMDSNNEGKPEVRTFFMPQELGVCSIAASYSDDDEGWDKAEKWFGIIDEFKAIESVQAFLELVTEETNA